MSSSIRTARVAVFALFFINAAVFANWTTRIPRIKDDLGLSEGGLGTVLLGFAIGVLFALPLAGGLISRWGSRRIAVGAGVLNCVTMPFLALAATPAMLFGVLFLFGMTTSAMDIAMNAQAIEVQRRYGRSIMSSFHALFSIGGAVGAGMGGLLTALGLAVLPHFVLVSVVFGGSLVLVYGQLIDVEGEVRSSGERAPVFMLPRRALIPLGVVAFCSAIGEGAMADWSAVYLEDVVGTSASAAALGFLSFSLLMTIGRLRGDWLMNRFDHVMLVRVAGLVAGGGIVLAVALPYLVTTVVGFALVGAGLSFVIPLVFSNAGNMPGVASGVGIAGVATLGYSGFLAGPPVIGLIAEATSLRVGLLLVGVLILSLLVSASAVRQTATA